jgi:protocatechuate 3,4-dioxygenase beta subunit
MKQVLLILSLASVINSCAQQTEGTVNKPEANEINVGGSCEGCEALYECPVPFSSLNASDTIAGYDGTGTRIEVSGKILQADGVTPASNIIMYFYHTNQEGIYPTRGNESGWAKRHGYLRGWIRTDKDGYYRFNTMRPASYPNSRALAHIHATIKEPGKTPYYIDDFLFADDPFLVDFDRTNRTPRGGDGVMKMIEKDGVFYGERNIVLLKQ